ncbi:MAG: arginase family protein [Deltaproteobacteria bacterium]|nr:arginase family protein [Deltaproteobacteria bacterium]
MMSEETRKKIVFFGCPLDCDEKEESVREKLEFEALPGESDDPYDPVMAMIRNEVPAELWSEKGSMQVPGWLRPHPPSGDRERVNVHEFVGFTDRNGCLEFASEIRRRVVDDILPHIPCMIAVDHSMTGGVIEALSEHYGSEHLSLVALDSHTDAIPVPVVSEAIQYDLDTNPGTLYDRDDPFLHNRPDSYNAGSFLLGLLDRGIVLPRQVFVLGVSDYPPKRAFRIKDPRVARFVGAYSDLKRRGVTIVTKNECLTSPSKLEHLLRRIDTSYVYISVDMDIGARNALEGVRFRDRQGLQEKQMYHLANALRKLLSAGIELAGLDITEINPRRAGRLFSSKKDATYRIAANLIRKVAFGMEAVPADRS